MPDLGPFNLTKYLYLLPFAGETLRLRDVKKLAPNLKLQRWNPNLGQSDSPSPKLILFQISMPYWKIKCYLKISSSTKVYKELELVFFFKS